MTPKQPNPRHRKKLWCIPCLVAVILAALWLVIDLLLPGIIGWAHHAEASSIGIIGGADGPTAIFITSQPSNFRSRLIPLAVLILGILGLIRLWHPKVNTKKEEGEA